MKQGNKRVAEYTLEFRTLAEESGWNELALKSMFQKGLNTDVLTKLACQDDEASLDDLINLAICLDNLLHCTIAAPRELYFHRQRVGPPSQWTWTTHG